MLFPDLPQLTAEAQEVLYRLPVVSTAIRRSSGFVTCYVRQARPEWSCRFHALYSEPLPAETQYAQQRIAEDFVYEQLPVTCYE